MTEQILSGGQLSRVVLVDDTVRRPTGVWTQAVHSLLRHLESKGFKAAPRVLGIDEQHREILTYVPGESVSGQPSPRWVWTDQTLIATAKWLSDYHRAVSDFREPPNAVWRMNWSPQGRQEIICHFDVAPYNLVLMFNGEISVIDWDVAAPGLPVLEVAKVANSFSPLNDAVALESLGLSLGEMNKELLDRMVYRTRLLLANYGIGQRHGFVDMMALAAKHSRERIVRGAIEGDAALQSLIDAGVIQRLQQTEELIGHYRDTLIAGIER